MYYYVDPVPGKPIENSELEDRTVLIKDIRLEKFSDKYTIDKTGFQVIDDSKHNPDYDLFSNDERYINRLHLSRSLKGWVQYGVQPKWEV